MKKVIIIAIAIFIATQTSVCVAQGPVLGLKTEGPMPDGTTYVAVQDTSVFLQPHAGRPISVSKGTTFKIRSETIYYRGIRRTISPFAYNRIRLVTKEGGIVYGTIKDFSRITAGLK